MQLASRLSSHFPYSTAVFPRPFRSVSGGRLTASTSGYEQNHLGPVWPGSEIDSASPARGIPRNIEIPFDIGKSFGMHNANRRNQKL
jgi:hypothetical protein